MLRQTAENYAKILDVNLDERLKPISHSVDEMLIRLEEFETMIALVQQERCNSIGITGTLTQTVDNLAEFKNLCTRIDVLEKVIEHVKNDIDILETKVDTAEKQLGVNDSASKLKNLLAPIFRKVAEENKIPETTTNEPFSTEKYFLNAEENP